MLIPDSSWLLCILLKQTTEIQSNWMNTNDVDSSTTRIRMTSHMHYVYEKNRKKTYEESIAICLHMLSIRQFNRWFSYKWIIIENFDSMPRDEAPTRD